jgi:hypothetical protein
MAGAERKLARRARRRQPMNGTARRRATPRGSQSAERVIPSRTTDVRVFPACEAGADGCDPAIAAMHHETPIRGRGAWPDAVRDASSAGRWRWGAPRDSPMKNAMKSPERCVHRQRPDDRVTRTPACTCAP